MFFVLRLQRHKEGENVEPAVRGGHGRQRSRTRVTSWSADLTTDDQLENTDGAEKKV